MEKFKFTDYMGDMTTRQMVEGLVNVVTLVLDSTDLEKVKRTVSEMLNQKYADNEELKAKMVHFSDALIADIPLEVQDVKDNGVPDEVYDGFAMLLDEVLESQNEEPDEEPEKLN